MRLSFARTIVGSQPKMKLLAFSCAGATAKKEITTLTLATFAGSTSGDHVIFYDAAGQSWAFALDKTGSAPEPTGALWVAVAAGRKVNVDVSGLTTAAQVAAAVEAAINGLTGFTAAFTTDDTAADGTLIITCDQDGPVTDAETYESDESGAGSTTVVVTQNGAASLAALDAGKFDATLSGSDTDGEYTLTFGTPFEKAPQVVVMCATDNRIARIAAATAAAVTIQTEDLTGAAADSAWHAFVVGGTGMDAY